MSLFLCYNRVCPILGTKKIMYICTSKLTTNASEYEKQTTFTLYHDYGNCVCGMLEQ